MCNSLLFFCVISLRKKFILILGAWKEIGITLFCAIYVISKNDKRRQKRKRCTIYGILRPKKKYVSRNYLHFYNQAGIGSDEEGKTITTCASFSVIVIVTVQKKK